MAKTFKFGENGKWATKTGSSMAYNDQNGNFKPMPFEVTRDSIATRVNKQGLIEVVGNDKLRIDYTDSSNGVALLEPARTNLITYSEDFSQSVWNELRATITANSTIAPDGNNTATLLKEDTTASNTHIIYFGGSLASSTYSMSVFAKAKERTKVGLGTGNITQSAIFDLSNGTIINTGAHTASIENYGNGWYRCNINTTTTTPIRIVLIDDNNNTSYTGDGVSGLYIWGCQTEAGSYPTSYIPATSGSTVQREEDIARGAGNAQVFNDSEGVLFANIAALVKDNDGSKSISISDNSYSNSLIIQYTTNENQIVFKTNPSHSTPIFKSFDVSDITLSAKFAFKYKLNDCSFWHNGFKLDSVTSFTPFSSGTLSVLNFDRGEGGEDFEGKTKEIGYYDAVLTDAELEALTSYTSFTNMANELNLTIK